MFQELESSNKRTLIFETDPRRIETLISLNKFRKKLIKGKFDVARPRRMHKKYILTCWLYELKTAVHLFLGHRFSKTTFSPFLLT